MTVRYVFREDFIAIPNAAKADPQRIGEALAEVAEKAQGHLTPAAVVRSAKDVKSPLHPYFEWSDAKAANAHRLEQARTLIRSIKVEDEDNDEALAPAFISVSGKAGVSYRSLGDVKASPDLQRLVLAAAERDLQAFERRYSDLQDVCAIVREARKRLSKRMTEAKEGATT